MTPWEPLPERKRDKNRTAEPVTHAGPCCGPTEDAYYACLTCTNDEPEVSR